MPLRRSGYAPHWARPPLCPCPPSPLSQLHASRLAALLRLVVSTAHGYNDVVRWRAGYLSPACFVAYHALVYCLPFDRVLVRAARAHTPLSLHTPS